jgi:ubiquinone/menaquinone biosynthesis C-methylase UbiE
MANQTSNATTQRKSGPTGRGFIGTMAAMSSYDDESYLDFIEGLRMFALRSMNPSSAMVIMGEIAAGRIKTENPSIDEIRAVADQIPVVGVRNRMLHSTQGLNWRRIVESYGKNREALEQELADAEKDGPGTLRWDPNFVYPEYFTAIPYHRQPGSYHADPLGGHIYHYGTKVFHGGSNDKDEAKIERIVLLPEPKDGVVNRFLDIACAIGSGTVAAKLRWPGAEVHGIELAGPLVRYAHMRASRLESEVHFSQQLAEDLDFADNAFDLIYMSTLLHEMPLDEGRTAVIEAKRVLRPGGILIINDMVQATRPLNIWSDYDRHFDHMFNNEPYAYNYVHSNLDSFLNAEFSSVENSVQGKTSTWTCQK